jgi:alkyldihydroxyacetonephosphate synthase
MTRVRSHWGWGWADLWPDAEARRAMGEAAVPVLGFTPGELREPVPESAVALPSPRRSAPPELDGLVDDGPSARLRHTWGRGYRDLVRGFEGRFDPAPDLVARPGDETELARVLEWCAASRVAVVPFGGGTSVVGGVEPPVDAGFEGTLSLDLGRLDRVLEVDPVSRLARVEAGILGPALERGLGAHGLTLRHFPQSFELSSLGGWIATRAGGHEATGPTHIDDKVAAIRMLTPSGVWASRPLPGSGAGPSPDRLALGSEGTLGVITEAWLRVQARPRFRAKASLRFDSWAQAVAATRAVARSGLMPSNCRALDPAEAALSMLGDGRSSVLLLGFESADHPLEPWMARAVALAEAEGGRLDAPPRYREAGEASADDATAAQWRDAFLQMPYLWNVMVSLGVVVDTFETACRWSQLDALYGGVVEDVGAAMRRVAGAGRISCRFTHVYPDGPAPYFTFLAPGRRGAELEQHAEIKAAASEAILRHGGTITHHHAVGRLHRPWYRRQRPEPFAAALAAAKSALDPSGILNPGVLL